MLRSALIVEVPEAEPLVGAWRAKHDWSAQHGVPAHITVLFPFVEKERIDDALVEELRTLFAAQAPIQFSLAELCDFPDGTLWLAPEPAEHFRRLTERVVERWPDYPPYEGIHDEVIPHLTVAEGDPSLREGVEASVAESLPLQVSADAVTMLTEGDDGMWSTAHRFPLGSD